LTATVARCWDFVDARSAMYGSPVGVSTVAHDSGTGGSFAGATSWFAAGPSETLIEYRDVAVGTSAATFRDRRAPCCVRSDWHP
jgi:hypothetical protein